MRLEPQPGTGTTPSNIVLFWLPTPSIQSVASTRPQCGHDIHLSTAWGTICVTLQHYNVDSLRTKMHLFLFNTPRGGGRGIGVDVSPPTTRRLTHRSVVCVLTSSFVDAWCMTTYTARSVTAAVSLYRDGDVLLAVSC